MPRLIVNPYALPEEDKHRLILDTFLGDRKISKDEYERLLSEQKRRMTSRDLDEALGMVSPPSAPVAQGAPVPDVSDVLRSTPSYAQLVSQPAAGQQQQQQFGFFTPESFTGPRVMRRTKEDLAIETRMLAAESDEFESIRQQLTENYERMDSFAKAQYSEMNKLISGIDNARNDGRLRPIEYLRAMSTIAARARQFNWKYHFKAPGGEAGDVINKNGVNYMRQPDGSLKYAGVTPEYVKQNSVQLPNGQWWVPLGEGSAKILDENPFVQNTFETMGPAERMELREKLEARISRQVGNIMKSAEEMGREISPKEAARMAMEQIKAIDEQLDEVLNSAARKAADPAKKAIGRPTSEDEDREESEKASMAAGQMAEDVQGKINQDIAEFNSPEAQKQRYVGAAVKAGHTQEGAERLYDDGKIYLDEGYLATKKLEPIIPVPREDKIWFNRKLKKAKNEEDKDRIRAENWQSDTELRYAAHAPTPLRSNEDFENLIDGRVYLVKIKGGVGYDRYWYKNGKFRPLLFKSGGVPFKERPPVAPHLLSSPIFIQ